MRQSVVWQPRESPASPVAAAGPTAPVAAAEANPAFSSTPADLGPRLLRLLRGIEERTEIRPGRSSDVWQLHAMNMPLPLSGADAVAWLLGGVTPETEFAEPTTLSSWFDSSLHPEQRQAVQQALATEDLYLLAGGPGTGKTRVVAEVLAQAARRGWRVLLTAPSPAALDACLTRLHGLEPVFAVRLPAPNEDPDHLPEALRELCLPQRVAALNQRLARHLDQQIAELDERERALHDQTEQLLEMQRLAARWKEVQVRRSQLLEHQAGIRDAVLEEARRADTPDSGAPSIEWVKLLLEERRRHQTTLEDLAQRIQQVEEALEQRIKDAAQWQQRLAEQEQIVQVRRQGNLFSLRFWMCWWQGRATQRLEEFRQRAQEAVTAAETARIELESLKQQRTAAEQRHAHALEQIVADECARRIAEAEARLGEVDREANHLLQRWNQCLQHFPEVAPAVREPCPETVRVVESRRQTDWEETQSRRRFLHAWQEDQAARDLSPRAWLPCFNVVAATVESLLDQDQGQAVIGPFDLVVIEQADRLADGPLLALTRLGRRCMLVGLPPLLGGRLPAPGDGLPHQPMFHRLWQRLHPFLRHRNCRWVQSDREIVCQLLGLQETDRSRLDAEPLLDQPEVELRILNTPDDRPVLAEVAFPLRSFSIAQAKEFLYQQLGELPLRPESEHWHWAETSSHLTLDMSHLADCRAGLGESGDVARVELQPGVAEIVASRRLEDGAQTAITWCTQRLEFERACGWDHASVARWLKERVGPIDLGRTGWLRQNHRATRPLAEFLHSLLLDDEASEVPRQNRCQVPMRWEVVADASPRVAGRGGKGRPRHETPFPETQPIDLADPRQRQHLPLDLQLKLPMRGLVNLAEARHVVSLLGQLIGQRNGTDALALKVAVLSWSAPQVQLVESLWRKSQPQESDRICFSTIASFRDREADIVLVSLVRSGSRPSGLADHPADWWTALGSARQQVILIGDPEALARSSGEESSDSSGCGVPCHVERKLRRRLVHHLHAASARSGEPVPKDARS